MKYKFSISVIMPCYGNSISIYKSIESILNQSFKNFEFIIISDGSDESIEYEIKKFNDSRVTYLKDNNIKGIYSAINKGVSLARGKYICLMDSNALAKLRRLELQYNYLESHKHVGFITGAFDIINNTKVHAGFKKSISSIHLKVSLLKDCIIHQSTMMMRSYLFKKHHLRFSEDEKYEYLAGYKFFVKSSGLFHVKKLDQIILTYIDNPFIIYPEKIDDYNKAKDIIRIKQLKLFNTDFTNDEINLHLKLINEEYISDESLILCEIWLNKLLEANNQLKLYSNSSLYKLFEYLLNVAVKKNALGGWSIEKEVLDVLEEMIPKGASILEFGSGDGTTALLENYQVTSVEHDKNYCFKRGESHHIIHAKIENKWYNKEKIREALKTEYDLLLIDGPPEELRAGILLNIDLFKDIKSPIIFDDTNRPLDKEVMIRFCEKLNYEYKIVIGENKEFAICTKILTPRVINNSTSQLDISNDSTKTSSAILLLTNKTHKGIFQSYKLLNEVGDNHEAYVLLHNKPEDQNKSYIEDTKVFAFEDDILKNLGYTPIGDNLLPGSNHFPLLKFYRENPDFDFYWCIEDDVFYNGNWSEFFSFFQKNKSSDFISSHITDFEQDPNWYWWNTLIHPDKIILNRNKIRSFNPIYRLSNKALNFLDKQLKDSWQGHHEVLIPTLLKQGGFNIQDFGGVGKYVPNNCKNKFYFKGDVDKPSQFNIDSMRYRPIIEKEEIKEKLLYHPVKFFDTNKYCIVAAVGRSSLHQEWINEGKGGVFDLHLIVYDDSYDIFKLDTPYITASKGYKFNLIQDYLNKNPHVMKQYDYFYMPDDDISIDYNNIKKLFNYMQEYKLAIAQPAIANSFYSYPHTTRKNNSTLRYTSFVEVMQPCFSRSALEKVLFTFNGTKSGWGIDFHWGKLLDYTKQNMAIIDDVYSEHTRPVQSNHHKEMKQYMEQYNLSYKIYCS